LLVPSIVHVYCELVIGVTWLELTPLSTLIQFENWKLSAPDQLISNVGQNQKSADNWILSGRVYVAPREFGWAEASRFPWVKVGVPGAGKM
jgi:hypothetical protein